MILYLRQSAASHSLRQDDTSPRAQRSWILTPDAPGQKRSARESPQHSELATPLRLLIPGMEKASRRKTVTEHNDGSVSTRGGADKNALEDV